MGFIERLGFGDGEKYSAIEAAIHLNRYSSIRDLCKGKRVLDIACGEGYGSYIMAEKWGAVEVFGVDISQEAIDKATAIFTSDKVKYSVIDAERDSDHFEEGLFDLVVSFETIEHVSSPIEFLCNIKKWLKKDGTVIISCPNDNWYYPTDEVSNPFHQRKYTFQEFVNLCEGVLGKASKYQIGLPISGFSNISVESDLIAENGSHFNEVMLKYDEISSVLLPATQLIELAGASYFIGIWSYAEVKISNRLTGYPLSMDEARVVTYREHRNLRRENVSLQQENSELKAQIDSLELRNQEQEVQLKKLLLAVKGLRKENEYFRKYSSN